MAVTTLSDTAYWMAYVRALEAERPDALFKDHYSRLLAGEFGEAIAHQLGSIELIANSIAVRTAVMDRLIDDMVSRLQLDLILNMGSGLDTRPWRLTLPRHLTWIDLDRPEILDHKTRTLADCPPACRYQAIELDILNTGNRRAVLQDVGRTGRALVVTEGLLVYLRASEVAACALDLHRSPACQWWLTDLVGPRALARLQQEWTPRVRNAQFHFAPADSASFFARSGWREAEFHSSSQEAQRLRRAPPLPWLARLTLALSSNSQREEYRRLAGIAVLARNDR